MKKIILLITLAIGLVYSKTAYAHVRYLVNKDEFEKVSGMDISFLAEAIRDPQNILVVFLTLVAFIALYLLETNIPFIKNRITAIYKRADGYSIFTPWIMRLSIGIALIGAGVGEFLISPALPNYPELSFIQIVLGFLFISGFMVVPASIVTIGLYFTAFSQDWYTLGNMEFLTLALSLLILDNEKPGIDDLVNLPKISPLRSLKKFVPLVLRIGIGASFIILALYEKILNPRASEIIVTNFNLMNVIPVSAGMWILSAGIIEFIIGVLLIVGLYTRLTSAIAFIVLSLSFFYFGEEVSSHIMLFGTLAVLFITSGGAFSLDSKRNTVNKEFSH